MRPAEILISSSPLLHRARYPLDDDNDGDDGDDGVMLLNLNLMSVNDLECRNMLAGYLQCR